KESGLFSQGSCRRNSACFPERLFDRKPLADSQGIARDHGIPAAHSIDCIDLRYFCPEDSLITNYKRTVASKRNCNDIYALLMDLLCRFYHIFHMVTGLSGEHPDLVNIRLDHRRT